MRGADESPNVCRNAVMPTCLDRRASAHELLSVVASRLTLQAIKLNPRFLEDFQLIDQDEVSARASLATAQTVIRLLWPGGQHGQDGRPGAMPGLPRHPVGLLLSDTVLRTGAPSRTPHSSGRRRSQRQHAPDTFG